MVHENFLNKEINATLTAGASLSIAAVGAKGLANESPVLIFMVRLFH
jgi:hypothetical protein